MLTSNQRKSGRDNINSIINSPKLIFMKKIQRTLISFGEKNGQRRSIVYTDLIVSIISLTLQAILQAIGIRPTRYQSLNQRQYQLKAIPDNDHSADTDFKSLSKKPHEGRSSNYISQDNIHGFSKSQLSTLFSMTLQYTILTTRLNEIPINEMKYQRKIQQRS